MVSHRFLTAALACGAASAASLLDGYDASTVRAARMPALLRARERQLKHHRTLAAKRVPVGVSAPPDQWFSQTLDHFNVLNNNPASWQQRFWSNTQYYNGSGLVFLYVEGEGTGSPMDVLAGQHVELAATYGAAVFALEHRFYGASQPTGDWSEDSLGVLSSHQAIGDIATFITGYIYPTLGLSVNTARVVTFGGSYPGALSAWIRLRLPHIVFAGFSTSSPVEAIADFTGYNDVVAASLSSNLVGGSQACLNAVTAAFQVVDAAMRGNASSRAAMSMKMSSCSPSVTDLDVANMVSNTAGAIMGIVQYNDEMPGLDVAAVCNIMTAPGVAPIDALATVVKQSLNGLPCQDNSYTDFIKSLANTTADPTVEGVGLRQWTWQTCSQFGYYQTCETGTNCPFSTLMTLNFSFQICLDGFDNRVNAGVNTARIDFTNSYLGSTLIGGSRILFTNGGIDPWHALSVLPTNNANSANAAVFIPDGAHCRQMQPSEPNDPADVKAARAQAQAILGQWLQSA